MGNARDSSHINERLPTTLWAQGQRSCDRKKQESQWISSTEYAQGTANNHCPYYFTATFPTNLRGGLPNENRRPPTWAAACDFQPEMECSLATTSREEAHTSHSDQRKGGWFRNGQTNRINPEAVTCARVESAIEVRR